MDDWAAHMERGYDDRCDKHGAGASTSSSAAELQGGIFSDATPVARCSGEDATYHLQYVPDFSSSSSEVFWGAEHSSASWCLQAACPKPISCSICCWLSVRIVPQRHARHDGECMYASSIHVEIGA